MRVVDHEPSWWFLLQDGEQLYFDVHCSHGFLGYSVLIALDEQETRTLRREGRGCLDRLAEDVNSGAPVLRQPVAVHGTRPVAHARRPGGGRRRAVAVAGLVR